MGIQGSLNSVYVLNFHNKKLKKTTTKEYKCLHKCNLHNKAYLITHWNIIFCLKTKEKFPLPRSKFSSYYLKLSNINLLIYYIYCLIPPTRI